MVVTVSGSTALVKLELLRNKLDSNIVNFVWLKSATCKLKQL